MLKKAGIVLPVATSHERKEKIFMIVILGLLFAICPFSIDMYLPGFPAIAADLHTNVAHVALSLSSFFIGISASGTMPLC